MILDKKQMTEDDIKPHYITPALQAKWGLGRMTMETKITDGRIKIKGNIRQEIIAMHGVCADHLFKYCFSHNKKL